MLNSRKKITPHFMRALEILNPGEDGALVMTHEMPRPEPSPTQMLIQIAYAGINRADSLQKLGKYKAPEGASPLPGLEVSGIITAVGEKVVGWSVGEKVCALVDGGGYADYVAVEAAHTLPLPARLNLEEAATLPEACATAWMALVWEGHVKAGERVLIHGGASGIGVVLVQVAKAIGAEVYSTAGTAEKCALLAKLGVTAIDYTTNDFAQELQKLTKNQGVDVIIDTLGAPHLATHLGLLRKGGRLVSLGFLQGSHAENIKMGTLLTKHLCWSGATLRGQSPAAKAELMDAVRLRIWPYLASGKIIPVIDSVFPFEEANAAHKRMEERLHCGKILLEVASPASGAN
ncbi:MAG: NAD(P)H-quinone oxidoreductase [Rickettsiales bacterium]